MAVLGPRARPVGYYKLAGPEGERRRRRRLLTSTTSALAVLAQTAAAPAERRVAAEIVLERHLAVAAEWAGPADPDARLRETIERAQQLVPASQPH